jgi:uncharacterized integral membrane protein
MTTAPQHPQSVPEIDELPTNVPTAPAPTSQANRAETRGERLRRGAHQGRLQGYAIAVIALIAALVALAAANTARVHVDWLVGSAQVSLVWLVLAAAIIGWILGVLASVRFQWVTRARPHRAQTETGSSKRRRLR